MQQTARRRRTSTAAQAAAAVGTPPSTPPTDRKGGPIHICSTFLSTRRVAQVFLRCWGRREVLILSVSLWHIRLSTDWFFTVGMAMSMLHQTIMLSERHRGNFKHSTCITNRALLPKDGAHHAMAAAYMRRPSNCMRPPPISRNKSAPATPLSRSATVGGSGRRRKHTHTLAMVSIPCNARGRHLYY